jgi:hypothetical protein
MRVIKQKGVWIDYEVIDRLRALDPDMSPNNHLRKFLGMKLNRPSGRAGVKKVPKKRKRKY